MKMIKIEQCRDPMLWYSKLVGNLVPYVGEVDDIYWSREPAGYKNLVYKTDACIVEQVE